MSIRKPEVRTVTSRNFKSMSTTALSDDISTSPLSTPDPTLTTTELADMYDDILAGLLDKHAPVVHRRLKVRTNAPWHSDEIREAKRRRRQAERKWRKTKLEVDRQIYRESSRAVNNLLTSAKENYYSNSITECGRDQKAIFKISKDLLGEKKPPALPDHASPKVLADKFCDFFTMKIRAIRNGFPEVQQADTFSHVIPELSEFTPATNDEISRIITKSPTKSCELDTIPTWLLKACLPALLPCITMLVNSSITTGHIPDAYKMAVVRPLLKKNGLDRQVMKNCRPVSNLNYLSKIIEKVVASRMDSHVAQHDLSEPLQSAYSRHHSTETALTKVQDDILGSLDRGEV